MDVLFAILMEFAIDFGVNPFVIETRFIKAEAFTFEIYDPNRGKRKPDGFCDTILL